MKVRLFGFWGCVVAATALYVPSASADFVDWYGGGTITNVSNCLNGNLDSHVNRIFTARYLPPNLGTNGNKTILSFLNQHWAQGYALQGSFTAAFKTVTNSTIARFPGPAGYPVQVRIISRTPAMIDETTQVINLQGQVKGFTGFPSNDNCVATFSAVLLRP
jgi:hypothetical protein